MPRTASARSAARASQDRGAASAGLDELIRRGRAQGHLSLAELRATFQEAGISAAEGRSLIRELAEAGVRLADESGEPVDLGDGSVPDASGEAPDASGEPAGEEIGDAEVEASAHAASEDSASLGTSDGTGPARADTDLDDQTPAIGDSVHTYLKAIGRTRLLTAEEEVDLAKRIEAGLYAEHKLQAEPTTDDQLRFDLEEVAEDGRRAKAHMLEANLRLVVSVAKKYSDRGLSLLDVVQEGNLGLIRAVEKFDYTKGYKFSTYAMWWIRQAIQRITKRTKLKKT